MPIPLPNLDDRRWSDLFEDGRANITRYSPQWTDHNLHDPGITLIDLYAWLAEMTNYRLNRVPSRHKRKFLELLGFTVQNPVPAEAVLSFAPAPATTPFVLVAGCEFEGTDPDQNRIAFRTLRDTTVQPITLEAVQVDEGSGTLADRTHDFADGFPIQPLGSHPAAGAALYLGFASPTADIPLALGLRIAGPGQDRVERLRIITEAAEEAVACQPVQTRTQCVPPAAPPAPALPPHHSVSIAWEAWTTAGWTALSPQDNTRSLTLDGLVEFKLPTNIVAKTFGTVATAYFYVRCRMTAGSYDAIPILLDVVVNAAPAEQAIPVTESFVIKAGAIVSGAAPSTGDLVQIFFDATATGVIQSLTFGAGSGPQLRVLGYKAPTAANAGALILDAELSGIGAGLPSQIINVRQPQAADDSVSLFTLSGTTWQQWTARDDFDSSTRTDFHFVLDAVTGSITFGTGERGQTPPADSMIVVRYRTTYAATGNVAPHTVNRARVSPMNDFLLKALPVTTRDQLKSITTNRAAAQYGAERETLDHALGRAVESLHAHERLLDLAASLRTTTLDQIDGAVVRALTPPWRGVNLLDLERLALSIPGTRIARAHAWATLDADQPCLVAPGVVTIIIVPEYPVDMPTPSAGLLTRAWQYLNRRRLVATTLKVTGPIYTQITVTASIAIRAGASPANVIARTKSALRSFLDPLGGGPAGLGWPFGRSVFRSEILQLIQDIPGVDYVGSLSMMSDSGGPQCGDIPLCPAALTTSGTHVIEVL
jgi:predicted phage baseplate assembly protein